MKNVALQLWSIREVAGEDLLGTIEKVAEMGYDAAQFAGFGEYTAEKVKAKMDEVGIKVAGAHVQLEELENDLEATLKFHATIGNDLIIVPYLGEERRSSKEDYKKIAEVLEEIGAELHAKGFTFAYHNHDFEFDQFEGQTGFEIIFGKTDPNHVKMELDCYWVAYAGYDPIDVIEKHGDRLISLHIKDKRSEGDGYVSTELGTGTLPLASYVEKGKAVSAKWFVVEQEYFTKEPLDSAVENAKVLKQIISGK